MHLKNEDSFTIFQPQVPVPQIYLQNIYKYNYTEKLFAQLGEGRMSGLHIKKETQKSTTFYPDSRYYVSSKWYLITLQYNVTDLSQRYEYNYHMIILKLNGWINKFENEMNKYAHKSMNKKW